MKDWLTTKTLQQKVVLALLLTELTLLGVQLCPPFPQSPIRDFGFMIAFIICTSVFYLLANRWTHLTHVMSYGIIILMTGVTNIYYWINSVDQSQGELILMYGGIIATILLARSLVNIYLAWGVAVFSAITVLVSNLVFIQPGAKVLTEILASPFLLVIVIMLQLWDFYQKVRLEKLQVSQEKLVNEKARKQAEKLAEERFASFRDTLEQYADLQECHKALVAEYEDLQSENEQLKEAIQTNEHPTFTRLKGVVGKNITPGDLVTFTVQANVPNRTGPGHEQYTFKVKTETEQINGLTPGQEVVVVGYLVAPVKRHQHRNHAKKDNPAYCIAEEIIYLNQEPQANTG